MHASANPVKQGFIVVRRKNGYSFLDRRFVAHVSLLRDLVLVRLDEELVEVFNEDAFSDVSERFDNLLFQGALDWTFHSGFK